MIGTYRFYQEGILLGEHKNLVTTEGAQIVQKYLTGQIGGFGNSIAIGTAENAPAVTDDRLGFEVSRSDVTLKTVDFNANAIVFKTTIPADVECTIKEVGLWNLLTNISGGKFGSKILSDFANPFVTWSNSTTTASNIRVGTSGIIVAPSANSTVKTSAGAVLDLSGYSIDDEFSLAFYKPDNNVSSVSIEFSNSTTGGKFVSSTTTVSSLAVGYNVVTVTKGDFTASGTIAWDSIDTISVNVTAGATGGNITLDGVLVEISDRRGPGDALISRTVLGTPIIKTNIMPMEIEYSLQAGIA